MFERQERVAILLLCSVALTVIGAHLVLSSIGKQPFARPFNDNSAEGELVTVQGNIDQITFTQSGGHMIMVVNNLSVFVPAQIAQGIIVQKGDRILVYGLVQTYRGKKEIVVNSAGDIRPLVTENSTG